MDFRPTLVGYGLYAITYSIITKQMLKLYIFFANNKVNSVSPKTRVKDLALLEYGLRRP